MIRSRVVWCHERDGMLPAFAACLFLLVTVTAGGVHAQDCIDYRDYLRWVGGVDTPGEAVDVAVAGNYAYVADVGAGLQVVDISDPAAPRIVGSAVGASRGVAVAGDYVYVADEASGLEVVDISVPEAPIVIGSVPTPGVAWDVALAGSHACVVDALAGLQVVDITDPASPAIAGSVAMADSALDVTVAGGFAYVTAAREGLQVVDISNPTLPSVVGSVAMAGSAHGVAVEGEYAYVAVAEGEFQVVDISNPAMPMIVGSAATGSAHGVAVAGDYAYVAAGGEPWVVYPGVRVVDISNPASPEIVGAVATMGDGHGVAVAGNHAYVVDLSSGLQVVDISNPLPPAIVGGVDVPGLVAGMALAGHHAYVATLLDGLQVVDASNPASPTVVWSGGEEHWLYAVAAADNYVYLAGEWRTSPTLCFMVLDISNPALPTVVGHAVIDWGHGRASDIAVAGDYAYIADDSWWGALIVVDVSNPTWPYEVGRVETHQDPARGVAVAGDYAYVLHQSDQLQVVDVSDPASPVVVGRMATPGIGGDVVAAGDRAYVAGCLGLRVVDVSNPTSPTIIGGVGTPGCAEDVALAGEYAYIADFFSGLQVVQITNPAMPAVLGGVVTPPNAFALFVAAGGEYAYVTMPVASSPDWSRFCVCPIQCAGPTPVELASCEIRADDGAVKIVWEPSFASDHLGFHIERAELGRDRFVRVNDELIGEASGRSSRYEFIDRSVELGRTYVYRLIAVDLRGGTQTFALGSATVGGNRPGAIVLHQNQPNPFSASTAIGFELPGAAPVTLRLYDAHGRLVRTLADGNVARGTGSFEWDGRDDRGRRLGPGLYVYRLDAGDQTLSRRLLMLH